MTTFLYAEINMVGIALLLLMLKNMNSRGASTVPIDQRLFNGIMFLNILIFLFDTGMWLVDGSPLSGLRAVNYVVTTGYYILNPLICFLWLMYTDSKIYESRSELLKRTRLYAIPAAISALLSLASPFTGWFFVIDPGNHYSRGPLFLVMALAAFFYLILALGMAIRDVHKNGWAENKKINFYLVVFPIGIISASTIQILFFGLSIIWVCCMLACASIYINIQNGEISTDYLTGLHNRRRLDQYLQRRTKIRREGRLLFAILLDLDEFKSINDTYGHLEGDAVLIRTAGLLRQICKGSDDFIARLGGDEFIIVGERIGSGEIQLLMTEIQSQLAVYNQSSRKEYAISFSVGHSVFGEDDSVDSFLAAADREMYRHKQEKKLARSAKASPDLPAALPIEASAAIAER